MSVVDKIMLSIQKIPAGLPSQAPSQGRRGRHSLSASPYLGSSPTLPLSSPRQLPGVYGAGVKVCQPRVGRASERSTLRALKARPTLRVLRSSEIRLPCKVSKFSFGSSKLSFCRSSGKYRWTSRSVWQL